MTFQAIPCVETYCFRPAVISKPRMAGTLPARVTSTKINDLYGHIDRDGRYRVNLLFDRDRWQPGRKACGCARRALTPVKPLACICRC